MGWTILPARAPALIACMAALACAALLFSLRPDRPTNRRLAFLIVCESAMFACGEALMYMTDDASTAFAFQHLTYAIMIALPAAYVQFFATLPGPVARAMRHLALPVTVVALGLSAWTIVRPFDFVGAPRAIAPPAGYWDMGAAPFSQLPFFVLIGTLLVALLVAIGVRRAAKTPLERRQANVYFAAFGLRDASFILASLIILGLIPRPFPFAAGIIGAAGYVVFVAILTYGILRAQLFDIDLKIKWTIRRGTVVGVLAVAFVAVAEVAQNWLSDAFGYLAGGIAAATLLVALRPLDRLGSRMADRAIPNATGTPEYLAFRKHEVYRQALADAATDGVITDKERAILHGLRKSLEIDASVAEDLEKATMAGA